jgi:hypothetical protein
MNKPLFGFVIMILFTLMGCSNEKVSVPKADSGKPPTVFVKIGDETHKTTLGTYCWKATCVDTLGPRELLKGKKPINVKPGETISLVMDYKPKPTEFHVVQMNENKQIGVMVIDNQFTAPAQKGTYYYSYGVQWMDKKKPHVSNDDAEYAFALEVN